jgi:TAP-like protein
MLFVSQTLDPVTPLRNAKVAAAKFDGAGLIECAGVGHCSIASPSMCTAKVIGDYFQNGRLPVPGTVCEVDITPFEINETRQKNLLKRQNGADGELWKAIISLSKV